MTAATATAVTYFDAIASPLGDALFTSDGEYLTGLYLTPWTTAGMVRDRDTLREPVAQMRAYLAGELKEFDLPHRQQGTVFQQRVWAELTTIPYGKTISYAELAKRVGQPAAARAVGSANGKNQICILVPCHRVIAADGTLGGYGGELWRKEWLLNLERAGA